MRALCLLGLTGVLISSGTEVPIPVMDCCGMTAAQGRKPPADKSPWDLAPHGSVKGTVTFPPGKTPSYPLVVYLECAKGEELAFDAKDEKLVISQEGAAFNPSFAAIRKGTSVTFRNNEDRQIDHNVYTLGAEQKDLGIYSQGIDFSHQFDAPGEINLHCSIHKFMDGKLFVAPNPAFHALEQGTTSFQIPQVPAGKYTLNTYQVTKRFRDVPREIVVEAGKETSVSIEMKR